MCWHPCLENFATLCHHTDERGHVPDEVFENIGFHVDLDKCGKPVRCPAGILQEHLQRAKSLSHENQKNLQREMKDETTRKQQNKLVEEKLRILHTLEDTTRLCKETRLELLGGPQLSALAQAELEHFNNKRCELAQCDCLVSRHAHSPLAFSCSAFSCRSSEIVKGFCSCSKVHWIFAQLRLEVAEQEQGSRGET